MLLYEKVWLRFAPLDAVASFGRRSWPPDCFALESPADVGFISLDGNAWFWSTGACKTVIHPMAFERSTDSSASGNAFDTMSAAS